jgi:Zn-dependent protease
MDLTTRGSLRLFRVADIDVYLHWMWFPVAFAILMLPRAREYDVAAWKVAEYVALFAIVLLHEFGHALACRSVGGRAEHIVLWPLGGIAYVAPPARPGAVLWSIAAGPLVNLVLVPVTFGLWHWGRSLVWPDLGMFLEILARGNLVLLVLNLVPVYPLDGGQILQALLWFGLGRWPSLMVVSLFGMLAGGGLFLACAAVFLLAAVNPAAGVLAGLALMLGMIAAFVALRSLVAFQQARAVLAVQALPRHEGAACPSCKVAPPRGPFWVCEHCHTRFDLFEGRGKCPACGAWYLHPTCPHCHQQGHIDRWFAGAAASAAPAENDAGPGGPV